MKTRAKKAIFLILRLIIILIVIESAGFVFLCLTGKKVVSLSSIREEQRAILDFEADPLDLVNRVHPESFPGFLRSVSVHPYLGFTLNEHLFYQDVDNRLPYLDRWYTTHPTVESDSQDYKVPDPEAYVIGITGGSVAQLFFLGGTTTLKKQLMNHDDLKDRNIEFVDLAVHGYKQPQQLMMLNYFLAMGGRLDMLINIDGFNEITLPVIENMVKNINPVYPRAWYFISQGLSDRTTLTAAGTMMDILQRGKRMTLWCSVFPFRHSYTASLFWRLYVEGAGNRIAAIQKNLMEMKAEKEFSVDDTMDGYRHLKNNLKDDLESVWKSCSLQMDIICRGNGIRYYHFLQPNQYFPGSKRLTAEEEALGRSDEFAELVETSYPVLIQKGAELVDEGVRFLDMTMVFAGTNETLYTDACCHFNKAGNRILAQAIGRFITEDLSRTEHEGRHNMPRMLRQL